MKAVLVIGPHRLFGLLSPTLLECLVCMICNSNIFHSFLFKLYVIINHILKKELLIFLCTFHDFFLIFRGVELKHFSVHFIILKHCIMIVHTLKMCAHLIKIFLFLRGVELRHFFHLRCVGVSGLCNLLFQQFSFFTH